ncbi:RDD family protein [Nostoc sp.]|uniref:RDD family protein n=1 Tax=Nostoc sp. TaxID=1180 RepID=UPI002FFBD96E
MSVQYAGFWKRFGAALIDGIILYIVERIIIFVLIFFSTAILRRAQGVEVFSSVLIIVISWLYYAFQESSPQQATLGKQALGIIVTDLNGNQISFGRATGRYFSKRMSEKFLDGIFCHSERNEVERRIPIFRYGWRCNTWLLLRWA